MHLFFMQKANIQNTASVGKSRLRRLGDYLLLSFASMFLKLHSVKSVRELPTGPPPRYEFHLLRRRVAGWDSSALKLRKCFYSPPLSPKEAQGMQGQMHKRFHGGSRLQRSLRFSILFPPPQPPPLLESYSDPGRAGTGESQVGRKREGRAAEGEARSRNE